MNEKIIVQVTCATLEEATALAQSVVSKRLVACASVGQPVRSWFSWKGNIEECTEYPLTLKTRADRIAELETEIRRLHSYETPEILVMPITGGGSDYLVWIDESLERRGREREPAPET